MKYLSRLLLGYKVLQRINSDYRRQCLALLLAYNDGIDRILDSAQHVRFEYTLSLAEVQCGAGLSGKKSPEVRSEPKGLEASPLAPYIYFLPHTANPRSFPRSRDAMPHTS